MQTREAGRHHHEGHRTTNPLRDIILGGQDGLVNALGIILGVVAATPDVHILIATVLAATMAESISMGAVAYTSAVAQRDYYLSEREREEREIDTAPEEEREEVRCIYAEKRIRGRLLDELVNAICSDHQTWLDVMMAEDLRLAPVDLRDVLRSSVVVTIATAIGHLIPLTPFFFAPPQVGLALAIAISTVTLFGVGAYQAVTLVGSWWQSGLRMVIIGIGAAFIGFTIAKLFHAGA